jgi:hypothetical protein
MPRGAKMDLTVTSNLREARIFEDERSFVSLDGHLFLRGLDKSKVRKQVFIKHKDRCVICGHMLDRYARKFATSCGAWHHPKNCDCVGCSELRCDVTTGRPCHAHLTAGFERVAPVEESESFSQDAGHPFGVQDDELDQ